MKTARRGHVCRQFGDPAVDSLPVSLFPVYSFPTFYCASYVCDCADTSLTNFSAFMLGSLTALPAVQYFCLYAGTAILFDFVFQVHCMLAAFIDTFDVMETLS